MIDWINNPAPRFVYLPNPMRPNAKIVGKDRLQKWDRTRCLITFQKGIKVYIERRLPSHWRNLPEQRQPQELKWKRWEYILRGSISWLGCTWTDPTWRSLEQQTVASMLLNRCILRHLPRNWYRMPRRQLTIRQNASDFETFRTDVHKLRKNS